MRPIHLQCDYMTNPIGFDFDRPTMSWKFLGEGGGTRQTAYQLQIFADASMKKLLFDTSKILCETSIGVRLDAPLSPMTRYHWRVAVWDERGEQSAWSEAAWFETGRYGTPWMATWISANFPDNDTHPVLRKGFSLRGEVVSARAYVCGLGLYELFINGARVGDEQLTPYCNAYDKWLQYQTFDITGALTQGENAVGAYLGNGWYKGRLGWGMQRDRRNVYGDQFALLCQIDVHYADGTQEVILTDSSWKSARSPFMFTDIYDGETYDARLEMPGWDAPGYDDTGWKDVLPANVGFDRLTARLSPPVRVIEEIPAKAILTTPQGDTVVDFGQNMTGWVKLHMNVPAGTDIMLTHGEVLDRDGNFYNENMRSALVQMRYIAKGNATESYAPHFTFFGFRYVKVSGWPGAPNLSNFTAQVVHTDMERIGEFSCSDERVNRLYLNTVWGQKSNFLDVPTDCPQRDERMGWTGDAQVFCATASMHMQTAAFFRKFLFDLEQEQNEFGFVPVVVPYVLRGMNEWDSTSAAWGDAGTIIPWTMYEQYGDTALLEKQYGSMKAWVEYIRSCDTEKRDLSYGPHHLGDWLAQDTNKPDGVFGATPTDLIASAYYAWSADLVSKAAAVLGYEDDAREYSHLSRRIKDAILDEFVTRNGRVVSETQTAQVVALHMNLLPDAFVAKAADKLAERVKYENYHLTTGFVGTPYLCRVLSANGYNEYAYRLLLSEGFPSWLYTVDKGATTMWERWNSIKEDGSMGAVNMNSFNHYAYGSIAEWMYRVAAGINPAKPGYHHALLAPQPHALLGHAKASIDTISGVFSSGWTLDGDSITIEMSVPLNATATIVLPDAQGVTVAENGQEFAYLAPIERGPGTYRFVYVPTNETIRQTVIED